MAERTVDDRTAAAGAEHGFEEGTAMGWSGPMISGLTPRSGLEHIPEYSSALASDVPVRIRASSNEAPDGLSGLVRQAVAERLETANRYPRLGAGDLAAAIAERLGASDTEIACADGSLSLLNYLLLAYCEPGRRVVHAWRSYEAYPICIRTAGAEPVGVPNRADGGHDLRGMLAAVDERTAAMILCSPNNPTGVGLRHDEVAQLLERVPQTVLVVLDEAYVDFDDSPDRVRSRELLRKHANLVILRTFSKAYALAGLRVGYLVANPQVVRTVRKVLPPFAVGALSIAAARAALHDDAHRASVVAAVTQQRDALAAVLERHGVAAAPSRANFIWLPLGDDSQALGRLCAEQGISTRVFPGEGIRISLGEPGLIEPLTVAIAGLVRTAV